jgi:hypothetical protein
VLTPTDYRFFDRRIKEMFTIGGTGINVHKYLGVANQTGGDQNLIHWAYKTSYF